MNKTKITKRSNQDQSKEILEEIKDTYFLSNFAGSDSMEHFIRLGKAALNLKKAVGHGNYLKTIRTELPHINIRTIQRSIRLATSYDFEKYEILLMIDKDYLYKLTIKYGAKGAQDTLKAACDITTELGSEQDFIYIYNAIKKLLYTKNVLNKNKVNDDIYDIRLKKLELIEKSIIKLYNKNNLNKVLISHKEKSQLNNLVVIIEDLKSYN